MVGADVVMVSRLVVGVEEMREGRANHRAGCVIGQQSAVDGCTQWLCAVFALLSTSYPVEYEGEGLVVDQMPHSTPLFDVCPARVELRVSSSCILHLRFGRALKNSI